MFIKLYIIFILLYYNAKNITQVDILCKNEKNYYNIIINLS